MIARAAMVRDFGGRRRTCSGEAATATAGRAGRTPGGHPPPPLPQSPSGRLLPRRVGGNAPSGTPANPAPVPPQQRLYKRQRARAPPRPPVQPRCGPLAAAARPPPPALVGAGRGDGRGLGGRAEGSSRCEIAPAPPRLVRSAVELVHARYPVGTRSGVPVHESGLHGPPPIGPSPAATRRHLQCTPRPPAPAVKNAPPSAAAEFARVACCQGEGPWTAGPRSGAILADR